MDKQGNQETEAESCTHDWRITDTQLSRTMTLYWVICRKCGSRREVRSYAELTKLGVVTETKLVPRQ